MNPIASLFVSIGADLKGVESGLKQSEGALKESAGRMQRLGDAAGGALKAGLLGAVGGVVALTAGLGAAVHAAMEAEEGQAQLNAVLESTGGKAGVSADMANELASKYQKLTRFEDDAVLSGENMLLTFTNIGKDVFPLATKTMLDMSQAMGQDVKSSAIQLGKAINDPIHGMTALTRVGVTFTEEQKKQVKALQESGDLMGAQKIILNELQTEFGGAAEAAGQTFAGQMDILNHTFGDLMETVGGALIPILTVLAKWLVDTLNSETVQNFVSQIRNLFEVLASGDDVASGVWEIFDNLFGPQIADAVKAVAMLFEGTLVPAILQFVDTAQHGFPVVQQVIGTVWNFIQPILASIFGELSKFWTEIQPKLQAAWNAISKIISDVMTFIGNFIRDHMTEIRAILNGVWTIIKKEVEIVWAIISGIIKIALDLIAGDFKAAGKDYKDMMTKIWDALKVIIQIAWQAIQAVVQIAWNALRQFVMDRMGELNQWIQDRFNDLVNWLQGLPGRMADAGASIIQGIIDGFWRQAGALQEALHGIITDAINNILAGLGLPPIGFQGVAGVRGIASPGLSPTSRGNVAAISVNFYGSNAPTSQAEASRSADLLISAMRQKGLAF